MRWHKAALNCTHFHAVTEQAGKQRSRCCCSAAVVSEAVMHALAQSSTQLCDVIEQALKQRSRFRGTHFTSTTTNRTGRRPPCLPHAGGSHTPPALTGLNATVLGFSLPLAARLEACILSVCCCTGFRNSEAATLLTQTVAVLSVCTACRYRSRHQGVGPHSPWPPASPSSSPATSHGSQPARAAVHTQRVL
jgi:hypothetical protein